MKVNEFTSVCKPFTVLERDECGDITQVEDCNGFIHNVTEHLIYSQCKYGRVSLWQISEDLKSSRFLMAIED